MSAPPARSKTLSLSLCLFLSLLPHSQKEQQSPPLRMQAVLCFALFGVWGGGSPPHASSLSVSLSLFSLSVHLLSFTRPDSASHQMGRPTVSCMLGFEAVAPKLREHTSQVVHFN